MVSLLELYYSNIPRKYFTATFFFSWKWWYVLWTVFPNKINKLKTIHKKKVTIVSEVECVLFLLPKWNQNCARPLDWLWSEIGIHHLLWGCSGSQRWEDKITLCSYEEVSLQTTGDCMPTLHTHTHTEVYIPICISNYIYICICIYIYICIFTYIYFYIYLYCAKYLEVGWDMI